LKKFRLFLGMNLLVNVKEAILHLAFPHVCAGCGTDSLSSDQPICLRCLDALPQTRFEQHSGNPAEKIFWGRLPVAQATAHYYFTKASLMQRLMHQFKYRGQRELGFYLGQQMGVRFQETAAFTDVDALVPLPLFAAKERRRGYNQAAVLCDGIADVLQKPVLKNVVQRMAHTESQTKKSRAERWQNIEGRFAITDPGQLAGRHVLLADDVVTTGATLEACGRALLEVEGIQLSIATLCIAAD
jgi:ComF family protein